MSFFSQLIELFETLFHGSNPEVRQNQDLRKIETELKNFQPAIYKSRQLLPNFAEVIRILHEHTQALGELFSKTVLTAVFNNFGKSIDSVKLTLFNNL